MLISFWSFIYQQKKKKKVFGPSDLRLSNGTWRLERSDRLVNPCYPISDQIHCGQTVFLKMQIYTRMAVGVLDHCSTWRTLIDSIRFPFNKAIELKPFFFLFLNVYGVWGSLDFLPFLNIKILTFNLSELRLMEAVSK